MKKSNRENDQRAFKAYKSLVKVATLSFEKGEDKSDLRPNINYGAPYFALGSLQILIREGRGGQKLLA